MSLAANYAEQVLWETEFHIKLIPNRIFVALDQVFNLYLSLKDGFSFLKKGSVHVRL